MPAQLINGREPFPVEGLVGVSGDRLAEGGCWRRSVSWTCDIALS